MPHYEAAIYEGRRRWAVFCSPSMTWVFPERYGRLAAERLARRLNREASVQSFISAQEKQIPESKPNYMIGRGAYGPMSSPART